MTPAEKLIVSTCQRELEDDETPLTIAVGRTANKLGLTQTRVFDVMLRHGGVS